MIQSPIPATPIKSNTTRNITPAERHYYSLQKEWYTQRVACEPCNRKLKHHLNWIISILEKGEINTLVAE